MHAIITQKVFLKTSPDSEVKIVKNFNEVKGFYFKIMRRIIEPENIFVALFEEEDVTVCVEQREES